MKFIIFFTIIISQTIYAKENSNLLHKNFQNLNSKYSSIYDKKSNLFVSVLNNGHKIVSGKNGDIELWTYQDTKNKVEDINMINFTFTSSKSGKTLDGMQFIDVKNGKRSFYIGSKDAYIEFDQDIIVNADTKEITNNNKKPWMLKTNLVTLKHKEMLKQYQKSGIRIDELNHFIENNLVLKSSNSYKTYQLLKDMIDLNENVETPQTKGAIDFLQCMTTEVGAISAGYGAYLACGACVASDGVATVACGKCATAVGSTVGAVIGFIHVCSQYLPNIDLSDPYPNNPIDVNGIGVGSGGSIIPVYQAVEMCSTTGGQTVCWTEFVIIGYMWV